VIIEAFAKYLQAAAPDQSAESVLVRWLWERLTLPAQNNVDRVTKHEITIQPGSPEKTEPGSEPHHVFVPRSVSGSRLLKSLYEYAMSYEQQKWSRWVHCVKASDFKASNRD
jgi:hypothetical protein